MSALPKIKEQREEERAAALCTMPLTFVRGETRTPGSPVFSAVLVDVSTHGLRFRSAAWLEAGTVVTLLVVGRSFSTRLQVSWSERDAKGASTYGLRAVSPDADLTSLFSYFCAS